MARDRSEDPTAAARELMLEHRERRRFTPFAARHGIDTLERAYDVQDAFVALRAVEPGSARAGYKIGLTSPRDAGDVRHRLAGRRRRARRARASLRQPCSTGALFVHVGIEFEIAVRLGRDLARLDRPFIDGRRGRPRSTAVAPAIEIVDDRGCDYATLDVFSLVADNAWNAGVVLGEFRARWPDLAGVAGTVSVNGGEVLDRGRGSDVLGHPLAAVLWLANHLARRGSALRAGEFVMTGSLVTTKFPAGAGNWRFDVSELGAVELMLIT